MQKSSTLVSKNSIFRVNGNSRWKIMPSESGGIRILQNTSKFSISFKYSLTQ